VKGIDGKLDKAWSENVRSYGRCEVCGRTGLLNAHHIFGRRNRTLRWELRNGVCLCFSHHKGQPQSAHEDPEWFREWLLENRTEDYLYLVKKKNEITKWTKPDKEEQLERLLLS